MAGEAVGAAWRDAPTPLRAAVVLAFAWGLARPLLLAGIAARYADPPLLPVLTSLLGGAILLVLYAFGFSQALVRRQRVAHALLLALVAFQALGSLGSVSRYRVSAGLDRLLENPAFLVSLAGLLAHGALLALLASPASWTHTRETNAPPAA